MFDLFRFIALRPPQATAQDGNLAIDGQSAFQTSLRSARAGNDPQTEMKKLAQSFVESEDFVKSSASLNTGRQLQELKVALNRGEKIGLEDLKQLVEHTFQKPAEEVVQDGGFATDHRRLYDTLLAAKLAPPANGVSIEAAMDNVRLIALISRAAANDSRLSQPGGVAEALSASVVSPPDLLPLPTPKLVAKTPPISGGPAFERVDRPGELRLNQNEFGFGPPQNLTVFGVQVPAHPKFNTVITAPQFRTGRLSSLLPKLRYEHGR